MESLHESASLCLGVEEEQLTHKYADFENGGVLVVLGVEGLDGGLFACHLTYKHPFGVDPDDGTNHGLQGVFESVANRVSFEDVPQFSDLLRLGQEGRFVFGFVDENCDKVDKLFKVNLTVWFWRYVQPYQNAVEILNELLFYKLGRL